MPIQPQNIRLVDIDAGDGACTVVLQDSSGDQRTYLVPSNWTGDLLLAEPGHGVLDLTSIAPQPGFGSVATAVQDAGFDPLDVVEIEIAFAGSGAVDDLEFCSATLARAASIVRNGCGENPMLLSTAARPVMGQVWTAQLDCTSYGSGLATLSVRGLPSPGVLSAYGEVLVDGHLLHRQILSFAGGPSTMTWTVPNDLALCGVQVHAQGFCWADTGVSGGKTRRIRAGLSNALDLTLGF